MRAMTEWRFIITLFILSMMSGCAINMMEENRFLDSRVAMAKKLEHQNKLADALVQWNILRDIYPQNDYVKGQTERLSQIIQQSISELKGQLAGIEGEKIPNEDRIIYLKILALQPTNEFAHVALKRHEWELVDMAAELKTEKIKQLFDDNQQKAKVEIDIARYSEQADDFKQSQKYVSLIQVSEKFLQDYPNHNDAIQNIFSAYEGLGNNHHKAGRTEEAIGYFEQAAMLKGVDSSQLEKRIQTLRSTLSNDFYRRGMQVFKSNIDRAVHFLKKSVRFNPDNYKAKRQLDRATKIQNNLKRIKQAG